MLSPLAMASQHSVGSMDMDDDTGPAGVVGKGRTIILIIIWDLTK